MVIDTLLRNIHQYLASEEEQALFRQAIELAQFDNAFSGFEHIENKKEAIQQFVDILKTIDQFYKPIGGLQGYHDTVVQLLRSPLTSSKHFLPPPIQDMRTTTTELWHLCYEGTQQLRHMAHIFAVGGAGDRLQLIDPKTNEPLPAACMPFYKHSLFERLIRDIDGLEYWHYSVFRTNISMPVLMMTSTEKQNDTHIAAMCEHTNWFGRKPIKRIVQTSVPLIDVEGRWIASGPLSLMTKPGGHGVLWRLAQQTGALQWMEGHGAKATLVRQINNPLSSLDHGLLSFIGYGRKEKKAFGFLSVPSKEGLSEGMNVLAIDPDTSTASISNVEYTQFAAVKRKQPDLFTHQACPANTNILFADLQAIEHALNKEPIPGMIVNAKTSVTIFKGGIPVTATAARLESSMQNIADALETKIVGKEISAQALSTFLVLHERAKIFSVAKKAYVPDEPPQETPVACLFDWLHAMRLLLTTHCHAQLPAEQTIDQFIEEGPSFLFFFHPALGPLWEVIGQKISHIQFFPNAHFNCEIAALYLHTCSIQGSFSVIAQQATRFHHHCSQKTGRAYLSDITIINKGPGHIDINNALSGDLPGESCEIILEGFSEVYGEHLTITGPFHLTVPDGQQAILSQTNDGGIHVTMKPIVEPSWEYDITWQPGTPPHLLMKTLSQKQMHDSQ